MKINLYLASIFKTLISLMALIVLCVSILDFANLSFTFDGGHHELVKELRLLTGRDMHIDGEAKIAISLLPGLLVQKIRISNSKNFNNSDFISASEVSVSVSLFRLLSGQIHLSEFSAENAKLSLPLVV